MAEDIVKRGAMNVMSFDDLEGAFSNVQMALPSTSTDPYLRMDRTGGWIFGAEGWKVQPGSKWAISPLTMQLGYVCWSDYEESNRSNEKLGEVMFPANRQLPPITSLPDHGFEWNEQVSFSIVCVSGEDAGTQTKYATTSVGGVRAVKEHLTPAMNKQYAAEKARGATASTAKIVPIVTLGNSSYRHKKYGEIFNPSFDIVGWATLGDDTVPEEIAKPEAEVDVSVAANDAEAPRRRRNRA